MRRARRHASRFAAIAAIAAIGALAALGCRGSGTGRVRVVVPRGATLRVAAESLASAGVVQNATMFRMYAMLSGSDRSIRAGTYVFQRGVSWGEVVDDLRGGKGLEHSITIPEGWSLYQIVPQLARVLDAPIDSVRAAVRDTALLHALDVPTPTLEGYLFPDTYVFPDGTTPRAAVRVMVDRFQRVWQPEWDQRLQALAMSRHDVMALASIVEKEARLPEERPVIAAVYLNRLKRGMLLQADPTVQYALGRHVARVTFKDLEIDSPYNTYRRAGLPPGPIASPGRPAIVASLNPANVPYLYFVAHPDGHHEFTTDFAAHSVAVRAARREWDSVAALRRDTVRGAPRPRGAAPARR
ncbi:MAG TPA: endolytic transglycosylase MltG [Gemmatimonadaceae bacterium]|nr:endolytic transglycosylase MltG [Gemmatimonadaceae bacterium]